MQAMSGRVKQMSATGLLVLSLAGLAPAAAHADPVPLFNTLTFQYTGAAQTWTVPSGVHWATFDVFGAQGGGDGLSFAGGYGGETTVAVALTPGQTLQLNVGGAGANAAYYHCPDPSACPIAQGGFNGGGPSGSSKPPLGAGGGGASDVRVGGFSNRSATPSSQVR
jgi:hypothetical protein